MCSFDSRNAFLILSGSGQKWHLNVLDLVSKEREDGQAIQHSQLAHKRMPALRKMGPSQSGVWDCGVIRLLQTAMERSQGFFVN